MCESHKRQENNRVNDEKHLLQKRHRCAGLGRKGPQDQDIGPHLLYL